MNRYLYKAIQTNNSNIVYETIQNYPSNLNSLNEELPLSHTLNVRIKLNTKEQLINNTEIIRLLIELGADSSLIDTLSNMTPYEQAKTLNNNRYMMKDVFEIFDKQYRNWEGIPHETGYTSLRRNYCYELRQGNEIPHR
jgi:hypothetical protein